jgi:hypothetical protein
VGLIADENNDCRWQALIVVGEQVVRRPEVVWDAVQRYGISDDEDMRDGVATVLLEHLLEHHFERFFPLVKKAVASGKGMLRDTLARCWAFGDAVKHWTEVEDYLKSPPESPSMDT